MLTPDEKRTVYLDTETTGLNKNGKDRIVEICVLDDEGEVLLHSLVNPYPHKEWPEAMRFHGITPERVRFAPTIHQLYPALYRIFSGARVVIYNAPYDRQFLPGLLDESEVVCCMDRYARHIGSTRWVTLSVAADAVGHTWQGNAHRALADTQAARSVWRFLLGTSKQG